ncbi:MAG TPA: endonuclease Q family protein [Candidatus Nanoarchaeia archaeon]|nr:endonuclease Q family protein [Candidatus Nanoarchaeia archaeon]
MELFGDFHIHGRYAQACSKLTTLEDLERNSRIKGLNVLGTGDAQHPKWRTEEIDKKLTEDENGILWTKTKFPFILTTEIALFYSQGGKGRKVHQVVLLPNKEILDQFRDALLKKGRIDYDGRPIFGMSSIEFVDFVRAISPDIEIIPAHVWTSWMAIFGSKSGFDSVEECFEDNAKHIHALETGISSNPAMNRRISSLDKYNLVSFSDPHSSHPSRLGRESTMFNIKKLTYKEILNAIRTGEGLKGTIECNPEYGKYHYDGHRNCNVYLTPAESRKLNGICPKCKQPLTIGVEYRIEQLADREKPINVPYSKEVLPLHELIKSIYGMQSFTSKKIQGLYDNLIKNFKSEYNILLNCQEDDLKKVVHPNLAKVILLNRENKIKIKPGYDGVYGELQIEDLQIKEKPQKSLKDF